MRFTKSRNRLTSALTECVEHLEPRQMLAAHIVGSPVSFSTIQAAVNAALPGNTIRVDAGVYHESVTVNKQLTLAGAPFQQSVVDGSLVAPGSRTTSFTISANDVTLNGFTIQNNTGQVGGMTRVNGAGVVISPGVAGAKVLNNEINHNVTGLYLANSSATDPAIISGNTFAYNNNPGINNGRGIYTDGGVSGGLLTNVLIDGNLFVGNVGDGSSGNPEAAIGLEAAGAGKQFNVAITNNLMVGNGKGLLVLNASGITFADNLVTGCTDTLAAAVRDEGNVSGLAVKDNTFLFNGGAAVMIDQKGTANGPSSNVSVNGNNFLGNAKGALVIAANGVSDTVNATNNWWGSFFGPSTTGQDSLITNGNSVVSTPFSRFPIF